MRNEKIVKMKQLFIALALLLSVGNANATPIDRLVRLPPFERAVLLIMHFEGWHTSKNYPYIGYGHRLRKGERYNHRTFTKRQGEALLRKDLQRFCTLFRSYGRDSLLLATLAYNVGSGRLLGTNRLPRSTLIQKLDAGERDIQADYIVFCRYNGKPHQQLLRRRLTELELLYEE